MAKTNIATPALPSTQVVTVVIPNNDTVSDAIDTGGMIVWKIIMPATWTTANLTFTEQYASDGTYMATTDDAGTTLTATAAASKTITLKPAWGIGAGGYCKIISTATQGGARTLGVVLRHV